MSAAGSRLAGLLRQARSDVLRKVVANTSARVIAILGLALATVVVARAGGAAAVGSYALLRMLPGLVGVLAVCGLPGAMAYFVSANREGRLWQTVAAILATGALLGAAVWALVAPLLASAFFPYDSTAVIAAAGVAVATQLVLTVGKTALQGLGNSRSADVVIAAEEVAFLPCYAVPLLLGTSGTAAVIVGLVLADVVVGVEAWRRVARHLGWRRLGLARGNDGWLGRPDPRLARRMMSYGMRGQVGGFITLLNLRLDFLILGALTGPAVLGGYAVASKYAELLKLPGLAVTWVSYPRFARLAEDEAARQSRRLLGPAIGAVVAAAVPVLLLSGPVILLLYGPEFADAVGLAQLLVAGMVLSGAAGVASGYLYGRGRPGLNSLVLGLGLVVTAALDVILIPMYGAMGAAIASTVSYLATDILLIALLWRFSRRSTAPTAPPPAVAEVG